MQEPGKNVRQFSGQRLVGRRPATAEDRVGIAANDDGYLARSIRPQLRQVSSMPPSSASLFSTWLALMLAAAFAVDRTAR